MLESAWLDYSEFTLYTREFVNLNHWAYYVHIGAYDSYINFSLPSKEMVSIDVKTALIYYYYLMEKALGNDPTTGATLYLTRVTRDVIPSFNNLVEHVDNRLVNRKLVYNWLLENHVTLKQQQSTVQFTLTLDSIYKKMKDEVSIIGNHFHMDAHAHVENMVSGVYTDLVIELLPGVTDIESWVLSKGLPVRFDDVTEYLTVMISLYENSTGWSLADLALVSKTHKALLAVIKQLSSYTIQLLGYTNSQPIKPVNHIRVTPGNHISLTEQKLTYYDNH